MTMIQNGRGGKWSFTPTKRGGGGKSFSHAKAGGGGHNKFWGSFYAVAWSFAILNGVRKKIQTRNFPIV